MREQILNFPLKNKSPKIKRTYDIDIDSYYKMTYLSQNIYQATNSDILVAAINYLIVNENLTILKVEKRQEFIRRSFSLNEDVVTGLETLNDKYPDFSISKLVNIALRNALDQETEHLEAYIPVHE